MRWWRPVGWALAGLLLASCAQEPRSTDEWFHTRRGEPVYGTPRALPERHGRAPAERGDDAVPPREGAPGAVPGAYLKWGLAYPVSVAGEGPARKPVQQEGELPAVVSRVPVEDKTVFLTFDDGIEKDPEFVRMARELGVPFSMFLTEEDAADDYGYFKRLQRLGNPVHGHTLTHPDLTRLDYAGQRRQICTQQQRIERRFGARSTVFRPPYGKYDAATLRAAGSCGVKTVAMWEADMKIDDFEYRDGARLRPGDIVLAHFRGPKMQKGRSMTEMVAAMLRSIQRQGYAIGRLEDYVP
ncbi:polysaccharide deacetylase family protein [Streptomyces boninensis]|uniref:polysaccharide deacetylase family protein n=1 Tax=Streptomyces boninensis TaxID=2039455 RepID=UPI003B2220EB